MPLNLDRLYQHRFDGVPVALKAAVWRRITGWVLADAARWRGGRPVASVLDPACGDGEFLNACVGRVARVEGVDLRPRSLVLAPGIGFRQGFFQELGAPPAPGGAGGGAAGFDLIWVSNLLEHLPTPDAVQAFLGACRQQLNPGGLLTIMGPNIKYCAASYWDFADHLLPLNHHTVHEHLASADLELVASTDRFLPYSFRSRLPSHPRLVQAYLGSPWAWPLLGKQFLIRARRP